MSPLPSHRIGIEYLEHCRVVAADGRLSYVRKEGAVERFWSIPHGNTAALLLGPGTSLTQQAARLLGSEGVLVAFCGGGGIPVYLGALNEYRPTGFLQRWVSLWQSEQGRLEATRLFQLKRIALAQKTWRRLEGLESLNMEPVLGDYRAAVDAASTNQEFLLAEAQFTKAVYRLFAAHFRLGAFKREEQGGDLVNTLLTQGNYLTYGLAASVLWVLGIPHSLPLNHGQTRRGALVFDVADLIKNACVTPLAFEAAKLKLTESQFRARCCQLLDDIDALPFLFQAVYDALAAFEGALAVTADKKDKD